MYDAVVQAWFINSSNKNHIVSTYMTIAGYDCLSRLKYPTYSNFNSPQNGSSAGAFYVVSTQLAAREWGPSHLFPPYFLMHSS